MGSRAEGCGWEGGVRGGAAAALACDRVIRVVSVRGRGRSGNIDAYLGWQAVYSGGGFGGVHVALGVCVWREGRQIG